MRRLARWLLNALTVMSLLLCVAACVLWVRSYWRSDRLISVASSNSPPAWREVSLSISRGSFRVGRTLLEFAAPFVGTVGPNRPLELVDGPIIFTSGRPSPLEHVAGLAGFTFTSPSATAYNWLTLGDHVRQLEHAVAIPLWFVVLVLATLPAAALRRFVRRERHAVGYCPMCSYSLQGNVSGVCPECGRAIEHEVTA